MIPRTFHDDAKQDRRVTLDFWAWLQDQPHDAWLLWARWANWDNADTIFELMLDRADCDLALVSWIFWGTDPGYYVRNPSSFGAHTLTGKIVANCEREFYRSSNLFYDRYEVAISAHTYLKALRGNDSATVPFKLPRILCGPFNGRQASIAERYDERTERDLAEIFTHLDGGLPRSEAQHWQDQEAGGNLWIKDRLALPSVAADPVHAYRDLDDAAYVEAIFGRAEDYAAARAPAGKARSKWWPFS
jgi:hypothetical protein